MELLSIGKAAKMLGVHPNRLRAWEKQGLIKPVRLPSGQRRYPVEEINRILGTGGMKAKPDAPGDAHAELAQDLLAIMTSFSARLYGARGGKKVRQGFRELIEGAEKAQKGEV
nr:MerR family DNA-binding transcriptional regulator [Ammonifex degensii]